jgi:hypothetical protein
MQLLSSLKSEIQRTRPSFFGWMNDGAAHSDAPILLSTPILVWRLVPVHEALDINVCAWALNLLSVQGEPYGVGTDPTCHWKELGIWGVVCSWRIIRMLPFLSPSERLLSTLRLLSLVNVRHKESYGMVGTVSLFCLRCFSSSFSFRRANQYGLSVRARSSWWMWSRKIVEGYGPYSARDSFSLRGFMCRCRPLSISCFRSRSATVPCHCILNV